jgi:hypothetical protein
VILSIIEPEGDNPDDEKAPEVQDFMDKMILDTEEVKDALFAAKVTQAMQVNKHRNKVETFSVGDRVMLSTLHQRREYKSQDKNRVAKFMPRFDGPYTIIDANPTLSSFMLELLNSPGIFPTFHISELKRFTANDKTLFPSREHARPGPIVGPSGEEEWMIDEIVDERRRGRGMQYLVKWTGYGDEENRWLPSRELNECEALDRWLNRDNNATDG